MDSAYVGMIIPWPLNFAPQNWAMCDGTLINVNSNAALFAILGSRFGGDGRSTFGLPDLRGKLPIGAASVTGVGKAVGAEKVPLSSTATLTSANLPAHHHPATATITSITGQTTVLVGTATTGGQPKPTDKATLTGTGANPGGAAIYLPSTTPPTAPVDLGGITTVLSGATATVGDSFNGNSSTGHAPKPVVVSSDVSLVAANSLVLNYIICVTGYFPPRN